MSALRHATDIELSTVRPCIKHVCAGILPTLCVHDNFYGMLTELQEYIEIGVGVGAVVLICCLCISGTVIGCLCCHKCAYCHW